MGKIRPGPRKKAAAADGHVDGQAVQNGILLGLPAKEYQAISSKLKVVNLPAGYVMNESGKPIAAAYFINRGVASIVNVMRNGKSVEVGLTGKEGFVGVPLVAGFRTSPTRAVMQVAGSGFRIRAQDLLAAWKNCPELERSAQRFSQELAMQATQVAACNGLHAADARLARWLLMSQDRVGGDVIGLTHEFLSHMLGTRRATVSVAAAKLQRAGLITWGRGSVTVKNRAGLERAACECYQALTQQSKIWRGENE